MKSRYYLLCAASGIAWAAVAFGIGQTAMGRILWGGVLASPLIGLVAGALFRPAYSSGRVRRAGMSLLTLYVAAALFGLACGLYDIAQGLPTQASRAPVEVVLQAVYGTLWGLTFTGYVILLWPLSYLNHGILGRAVGSSDAVPPPAQP